MSFVDLTFLRSILISQRALLRKTLLRQFKRRKKTCKQWNSEKKMLVRYLTETAELNQTSPLAHINWTTCQRIRAAWRSQESMFMTRARWTNRLPLRGSTTSRWASSREINLKPLRAPIRLIRFQGQMQWTIESLRRVLLTCIKFRLETIVWRVTTSLWQLFNRVVIKTMMVHLATRAPLIQRWETKSQSKPRISARVISHLVLTNQLLRQALQPCTKHPLPMPWCTEPVKAKMQESAFREATSLWVKSMAAASLPQHRARLTIRFDRDSGIAVRSQNSSKLTSHLTRSTSVSLAPTHLRPSQLLLDRLVAVFRLTQCV